MKDPGAKHIDAELGAAVPDDAGSPLQSAFELFALPASGIIRATHDAVLMIDEQQVVVAINPSAQRLLGCSNARALGGSLSRFIPERDRATHARHVQHFIDGHSDEHRMAASRQVTALRADGQEIPVEIILSRVEMAHGGHTRSFVAALMHDISDVRALQQELDDTQRRLRAVFDLAPIGIWITDSNRVVFANQAAARLFGADRGSLLGRSVFELLHPESHDALRQQVARVRASEPDASVLSGRLVDAEGRTRDVEIAMAALPDHGHSTVQMVVSDVTQRQRAADELRNSRQALRQLSAKLVEAREAERRRIARELHDELGQRLTALKMDLAGLANEASQGRDAARVSGMLAMLDETVTSLRRIAADLRPLMLDDLGLNAAIEWLVNDASKRFGVQIGMQLDEIDPAPDERVSIALFRMVQEALTNVARHARASRVTVELCQRGDQLVLMVQDNGLGFAEGALQREGSFGLMGMQERAHMLGGWIQIDNLPGGGGRLTVQLPLPNATSSVEPSA